MGRRLRGHPTTDPARALEGSVVPFAGPKGSGLAMMIDRGGLAAAITGEQVGDMYEDWERQQGVSHFMLVLGPNARLGGDAMTTSRLRPPCPRPASSRRANQVLLPGEVEERALAPARRDGVVVSGQVFDNLTAFASELGVGAPNVESEPDQSLVRQRPPATPAHHTLSRASDAIFGTFHP